MILLANFAKRIYIKGIVVQWLEHRLVTAEVAGSNPVNLVNNIFYNKNFNQPTNLELDKSMQENRLLLNKIDPLFSFLEKSNISFILFNCLITNYLCKLNY